MITKRISRKLAAIAAAAALPLAVAGIAAAMSFGPNLVKNGQFNSNISGFQANHPYIASWSSTYHALKLQTPAPYPTTAGFDVQCVQVESNTLYMELGNYLINYGQPASGRGGVGFELFASSNCTGDAQYYGEEVKDLTTQGAWTSTYQVFKTFPTTHSVSIDLTAYNPQGQPFQLFFDDIQLVKWTP